MSFGHTLGFIHIYFIIRNSLTQPTKPLTNLLSFSLLDVLWFNFFTLWFNNSLRCLIFLLRAQRRLCCWQYMLGERERGRIINERAVRALTAAAAFCMVWAARWYVNVHKCTCINYISLQLGNYSVFMLWPINTVCSITHQFFSLISLAFSMQV